MGEGRRSRRSHNGDGPEPIIMFQSEVLSACNAMFIVCVRARSSVPLKGVGGQFAQGHERGGLHAQVAFVVLHLPAWRPPRSSRASGVGGCSSLLYSLAIVHKPEDCDPDFT